MKIAYLIPAIAMSLMTAAPAFATDYFVVQNTATMECSVAQQKPTDAKMKVVGATYASQADADAAITANTTCKH